MMIIKLNIPQLNDFEVESTSLNKFIWNAYL